MKNLQKYREFRFRVNELSPGVYQAEIFKAYGSRPEFGFDCESEDEAEMMAMRMIDGRIEADWEDYDAAYMDRDSQK